ncbi:hypothetical protein DIPPA_00667 [Diplonema papillatum]|nr:hypothetical protein DIPPA_00667 [Diplonema papillatum]
MSTAWYVSANVVHGRYHAANFLFCTDMSTAWYVSANVVPKKVFQTEFKPTAAGWGGTMLSRTVACWATRAARVQKHDHVALGVKDLAVSTRWYGSVLSMKPFMHDDPQFRDEDLAMVRAGQATFALLRVPADREPLAGTREQKGHAALTVSHDEIRRLHRELPLLLAEHRAVPSQRTDVEAQDYGSQLSLFFYDPDGNELELCAWVRKNSAKRFV